MPTYNYKAREIIAKIVYYGPGRCGKTTNLQQIHARMRPETRSELLSVATETDRTIYFDLLPLNLGSISGMKFMVRLFTVPGQIYYAETRKLVLRGADGIVFVADSQDHMLDENRESLRDLKINLKANGIDYDSIPLSLQYNKRDLPRLIPEAELDATLNDRAVKAIPAVASRGDGVLETLRYITVAVFNNIKAATASGTAAGSGVKPGAPDLRAASTLGAPSAPAAAQATAAAAAPAGQTSGVHAAPRSRSTALEAALQSAKSAGRAVLDGQRAVSTVNASPLAAAGTGTGQTPALAPASPAHGLTLGTPAHPSPRNGPSPQEPPRLPPSPAKIGPEVFLEEFKSLAIAHGQLAERMSAVEQELRRLGRENQEIRELLARQLHQ